ncbi:MAG: DUF4595 domain-containing protein [Muribaculaceae bacterium]|nr:DUF4595 domain-containing protein [Muribaculaceae bacterium]
MTQYDKEQPSDKLTIFMQLNAQGYVSHALEVYSDDDTDTDTWDFGYNADGQLNYMKRSEGDNEITTITYTNGNITKVSIVDDEDKIPDVSEIAYTSTDVTTPLENKGGIMFWYYTFGVDMDEMEVIYYAGLLGKATKNLPVSMKDGEDTSIFDWKLNSDKLPIKVTIDNSWSSYKPSYEIKW